MSLTQFLQAADVRERFNAEFKKPKQKLTGYAQTPSVNPTHAQLIGTAFDYVLRFHVAATNKNVYTRPWIAEQAVQRIAKRIAKRRPVFVADCGAAIGSRRLISITFNGKPMIAIDRKLNRREKQLPQQAQRIVEDAKTRHAKCLASGSVSHNLIKSALLLAQLDAFYRCGLLSDQFGDIDGGDVRELSDLLEVARNVPTSPFVGSRVCVLNPAFGEASALVGGADADLLIDDTLIEVKTQKELALSAETFRQLMGYYVLDALGGFEPGMKPRPKIRYIAMYSSRFGAFARVPIESVVHPETFPGFLRWFEERALSGGPSYLARTIICADGTEVTI